MLKLGRAENPEFRIRKKESPRTSTSGFLFLSHIVYVCILQGSAKSSEKDFENTLLKILKIV